jgi:hypothetical protein
MRGNPVNCSCGETLPSVRAWARHAQTCRQAQFRWGQRTPDALSRKLYGRNDHRPNPDLVRAVGSSRIAVRDMDGWPADREPWGSTLVPVILVEPDDAGRIDVLEVACRAALSGDATRTRVAAAIRLVQ